MDDQLPNPVIKTDEQEAKFLEAAALADAGRDIPADLVPGAKAEEAPAKPDAEQSETEVPEKKDERPRDALGRFTKREDGTDIPEAERQPAEKPVEKQPEQTPTAELSEFEKKKQERDAKERERLEKTWENVNRRKDELAAREAELARRAQELQKPRQQTQQQRQFSSRDLWEASQDFKARAKAALTAGDYDAFNENNALAEQSEQHARQFYQVETQEAQQAQVEQYNEAWKGNMQKAVQAEPELFDKETGAVKTDTPLAKEMHALLESHGQVFYMVPDGFAKAVEIAKLRLEAGSASELRKANETLKTEVERLTGLTSISGSGPSAQPGKKKFEEMSAEEQEAALLAGARAVDEGRS